MTMTKINESFLIAIAIVLLVGILSGCGAYQDKVRTSNEAAAILGLKVIHEQEEIRRNETKRYVPMDQLFRPADGIPPLSQMNPGYRFEVRVRDGGKSFEAFAAPEQYGKTGRRSFYMNEAGVVRGGDKGGGEATATDSEVK